jgi:hypothetical protein
MRIDEVSGPAGDNNLVTILQFLRSRAHNKKLTPVISTQSLINMVKNQGGSEYFTFDNLLKAQEMNPAIRELIKNIDRNEVTLNGFGDETDASEVDQANAQGDKSTADPQKTVKAMAKSALANRS